MRSPKPQAVALNRDIVTDRDFIGENARCLLVRFSATAHRDSSWLLATGPLAWPTDFANLPLQNELLGRWSPSDLILLYNRDNVTSCVFIDQNAHYPPPGPSQAGGELHHSFLNLLLRS